MTTDKEKAAIILRNKFLTEVERYESVIGDMDPSLSSSMNSVAKTMHKRMQLVLDEILELTKDYAGPNPAQSFRQDYPALTPIVDGLSKLPCNKGMLRIQDLRALAKNTPKITPHSKPTSIVSPPAKNGGNPFRGFKGHKP